MPVLSGGQRESGLDRALQYAFDRELDDVLESGELPGERLDHSPRLDEAAARLKRPRPWQFIIGEERPLPTPGTSLEQDVLAAIPALRRVLETLGILKAAGLIRDRVRSILDPVRRFSHSLVKRLGDGLRSRIGRLTNRLLGEPQPARQAGIASRLAADAAGGPTGPEGPTRSLSKEASTFRFRDDTVGVVVVHGIGPQLAGQTLLDWTRPMIEALSDWRTDNRDDLVGLEAGRFLADPVLKASIDFSGETFPTVQIHVPGLGRYGPKDPRGRPRRWVFTETWWAQEIRPPALSTMISWLGEQGGVGRIVEGIARNSVGGGALGRIARVSLRAFVSVIVSFVLLLLLVLLGIAKLVPFGPLRNLVVLQVGASFLTDWFGGARTLLRDQAQSANVRGRLVLSVKALRAYGCRDIVVVAHSGGTMVSWMTLTDPAWPRLRVQKLITHGEALNLAWRLENANPDDPGNPTPPEGHRMSADLAKLQPHLLWRDFWATHDPAPAGRPALPEGMAGSGGPRFTEEKVWNRMSIREDHGGYWENVDQFVVPLLRELDVPAGDRTTSRFFDDETESKIRNRRKQRVGLLALWRRVTFALPVMALLAAATMTRPGVVPDAGGLMLAIEQAFPGHELIDDAGRWLSARGDGEIVLGLRWTDVYAWGITVLQGIFVLLALVVLAPARVGPLWEGRWIGRLVTTVVDIAAGPGIFVVLAIAWLGTFATGAIDSARIWMALNDLFVRSGVASIAIVVAVVWGLGLVSPLVRKWIRELAVGSRRRRALRAFLMGVSAIVLATVLVGVSMAVVGIALVIAGNDKVADAGQPARLFLLGSVLVLALFTTLTSLGTWRWERWDRREQRANRRRPAQQPRRNWVFLQAVLLSSILVPSAIITAYGHTNWTWVIDRGSWLLVIGGLVLITAMLGVARDVVETDTDLDMPQGQGDGQPPVHPVPSRGPGPP